MRTLVLALALAVVGCGGGGDPETEMGDEEATVGDEVAEGGDGDAPWEEEQATEGGEEAGPSGPARVTVALRVGSEDGRGTVRILDDEGETVQEGPAGSTFTVPAGTYQLGATIADEDLVIDTPTVVNDPIEIPPGESTQTVTVPVAKIRLRVMRRGRPLGTGRAELTREGGEGTITIRVGGDRHVPISPGRYSGVVISGATRTDVTGLVFMEGATQDIPINVQ